MIKLESLILSFMIDASEGRDVVTADVVGVYLLATMSDYVVVKITGKEVNIMCKVSEEYETIVGIENGKRVIYLLLKKALYGCM